MKRIKVFNPIIDPNACFECNGSVEEMHHIIPVVLGGKRVIPLCESCHGKVHNLHRKGHTLLIRSGLKKRMLDGKSTGVTKYGFSADKDGKLIRNESEQETITYAINLKKRGYSFRKMVELLSDNKMLSRTGKPFTLQSLHTMLKLNSNS